MALLRKELKLGFLAGGLLLAIAVAYVLVLTFSGSGAGPGLDGADGSISGRRGPILG